MTFVSSLQPDVGRGFLHVSNVFLLLLQEKNIVEEIESIMGGCVEQSSSSWVCIPQKSLAITHDFWNTNSLRWTPFHMGAHNEFSISHTYRQVSNIRRTLVGN